MRNESVDDERPVSRLGQALLNAIAAAGMSGAELGRRIGLGSSQISNYVTGHSIPPLPTVVAIEDALGLRRGEWLALGGYVDVDSVPLAILTAEELPAAAKTAMLYIYDAAVAPAPAAPTSPKSSGRAPVKSTDRASKKGGGSRGSKA